MGREAEMERVIQILGRRTKNNPCLIGEPGVGKTAIAEGLARRGVCVNGTSKWVFRSIDSFNANVTPREGGWMGIFVPVQSQCCL